MYSNTPVKLADVGSVREITGRCCLVLVLSICIGLLLPGAARAQSNQSIYTGTASSLMAPWQNWSWCATNLGATNFVYPGDTYSAQITYTAGYQGFYIENPGINTILYTNLTFWINGGSTGGQQISVYGLVNNVQGAPVNLNNYITGGSVAAGEWEQVTIPLADLGIANTANVDGFWLFEPTGSAQPSFYIDNMYLTAAPVPAGVSLAVNAGSKVRTVDSRIFGINTAVWDSDLNTAGTISLLSASNTQILRFPGGSLSDTYNWQTNLTVGDSNPWASNFDAFAAVVTGLHAQAFVTANYGSGTAQEAAAWVTYSNVTQGYGMKYWEIGNEVYGSWEYDTHAIPNDPYTYAVQVQAYIAAMKAVDPTIKIGVVAVTGEDSYVNNANHPATNPVTGVVHNGWTPVMLTTLKSLGVTPDFLIYHRYEQGPGSESDEGLLQAAQTWPNDAQNLRQMLNDYLGTATASGVELVCTENNSVSYNPGKQSTSLVNGLYLADSVGNLLQTEFNAMAWWDLRNGQQTGDNNSVSLYGWREYGDYGVLNGDSGYPTYYTMKLLQYLGAGGDSVVSTTSNYPLLSSYSVLRQNGTLSVLVINKSATNALTGDISLSNFPPSSTATVYSYGMPQDNAAETGAGSVDISQSTLSNVSANFSYSFPAYSLSIISFQPAIVNPVPTVLTFSPASVTGGVSSTGTVSITTAAPKGGLVVSLSNTSGAPVSIPTSVTVAAGKTSATFKATTVGVATNTAATITATANSVSASGVLTVNGPTPSALACSPTTIAPGGTATAKLTISTSAPAGGMTVALSSSGPVTVPGTVTLSAGATAVSFTVTGVPVSANTPATITATANGKSVSATVTVDAPSPTGLTLSPASVLGGSSSTGTVTINGPAPVGGMTVTLSAGSPAAVASSVTVAAGAKTATFTISTSAVSTTSKPTISATCNGVTKSATLTITAATLVSLTFSPTSVVGGTSASLTISLSGPAPTGGAVVTLSSTKATDVTLPAVTIPAGSSSVTVTITTAAVKSSTTVAVTGSYNGTSKSADLTLAP